MNISPHVFTLSGNHLSLDFVNTRDDRPTEHPRELLNSYPDLVAWGQQTHILTEGEAQQLLDEAARRPVEAGEALREAIGMREAMFRLFLAIAQGVTPDEADLAILNAALAEALARACVLSKGESFTWDWAQKNESLDWILWPVVRSTADLLTSRERDAVRVCESEVCDWLFLDTSKNQSRRWCNMGTCGNKAKAHRHYIRKKETISAKL